MKLNNSGVINIFILFLVAVSVLEGVVLIVCRPDSFGLRGFYYDNTDWSDEPHTTALDTEFSTASLKTIRQKLPQNIFSVEWKGFIQIPETAFYAFSTNSDDGSWLFVDENLVVDNGGPHGLQERRGRIHLLRGLHSIRIRYFQIGGFAALDVLWARESLSRVPLKSAYLLPPETGMAGFWLYQQGKTMLPFLLLLWGLLILWLGISTYRSLRRSQKIYPGRHLRAPFSFGTIISYTLQRLCIQPLSFTIHHIRRPEVYYWLIVFIYSSIIFLTLTYARTFSTFMMDRFGNEIFSQMTTFTLVFAAVLLFLYFMRLKTQRLSRFISFLVIVAIYGFFLSTGMREGIYTFLQWLGGNTQFLRSFDIYPIYAGEKVHFLEYGLLGLLLCKTLSYHIKGKTVYLLAIVLVYIIGLTDEAIQWALPNRVGEYRDIWMNFLSGGLAILAVALVIRPKVLTQAFRWSSLRPLCYSVAAAIVLTGLFLQVVHGFGSRIFMPDTGTEFVSAFSESKLLELDKILLQRAEGKLVEDVPKMDLRKFSYEAGRHHYLRNLSHRNDQLFKSYCEQEILKTYFRSSLRKERLQLFEYDFDTFKVRPDPSEYLFYRSPAQELSIIAFSRATMWLVVSIAAPLCCFLATCWPVSSGTVSRFRTPAHSRHANRRFEAVVLRPLFAVVLLITVFVNMYPVNGSKEFPHTNLLILTVDSCQPDYWSAYGYEKNTTPFFDVLAADGVLFWNAIVPTSWTIPSLASMLTGVNPNVHGIDVRGKLMDKRIPTLFEALEQQGYTIGDTSYTLTEPSINSVFKKTDISPEVALSEGRSEESYLLSWIEKHKDRPFFGWVHFHTSHLPYRATPPYNELFLEDVDPEVLNDEQIRLIKSNLIIRKGEVEFDKERHTQAVHALYAQTLRQQDAKIGKVLMKLDELGLRDSTLIVITADHGEELLEHGFVGHASTSWDTTVYDDLIQVPLLIYYPKKLPQGKSLDLQVRQIDIMPTVLDILGIPFRDPIQGKSYLAAIYGDTEFQETVFSETTPCGYSCPKRLEKDRLRSVRTNEWKLISRYTHDTGNTTYELYNLQDDPGERVNVIERYPEITEQFKQEMQRWMAAPQQFAYQHQQSEEKHYLDVDVEVRPIVQFPKVGTVMTPETYEKRILVQWIGDASAEYLIEYDIGTGGYHMTGELEVLGSEQWFGPFPEDIWQALPLYNPWKFRIIPKAYPQFPSEWITFEMQYE